MNGNNALNRLLLANPLDYISALQVHQDRVAGVGDLVAELLDLREGLLQTVPLRGVAVTSCGDGEGIREGGVVAPESEFLERGFPGEEV